MLAKPKAPSVETRPHIARVFVEVRAGSPDGSEAADIAQGKLERLARRELRIQLEQPLKTGGIHDIALELPGIPELQVLTCEVVSRHKSAAGWSARLLVLSTDSGDFRAWDHTFEKLAAA